jgi:hypothetical protein
MISSSDIQAIVASADRKMGLISDAAALKRVIQNNDLVYIRVWWCRGLKLDRLSQSGSRQERL